MEERKAPVLCTPETDSTNLALRRLAADGAADGTVFWAARQSAGRGRLGRSFASPEGGLYYSMLLDAAQEPARDLLLSDRKLCGILAEGFTVGARRCLALGIGINVNTERFPPELESVAVSLRQILGRETDLPALARALTEELDQAVAAARRGDGALLADYRARCLTVGRRVTLLQNGGGREAFALGVNDDFSLAVRLADGSEESVLSGEVSIR